MRHYWNVYKILLKLNFSTLLAYRANFINMLIGSVGYGIFSFFSIILLTSWTPVIFGWKREELIFLMGIYNIVVGGIFHMIFSLNFHYFAGAIDLGTLDGILLKPIDSQFLMSFTKIFFTQIARIIMGITVCLYIIFAFNLHVTTGGLFVFIILSLLGIAILYSVWYSVMILTIWNPRLSNLIDLMYRLNDLTRFPPQMYRTEQNYLFFIIPFTFVLVIPMKALLQKVTFVDIFLLTFFSLLFLYLTRKFWQFALRSYTSASS